MAEWIELKIQEREESKILRLNSYRLNMSDTMSALEYYDPPLDIYKRICIIYVVLT